MITKAFVMSAGLGSRLQPLTLDTPKPMLKIANKPLLVNTIELLKEYGITDIIINLHLHPEQIKNYFGNGSKFGVNIEYSYEETLLGTAGGLGKVRDRFNDTFIVMSGDGLIDLDIADVLTHHKQKKAIATIVLKRYNTKFKYGVVFVDDKTSKIKKFVEKPELKDIYENRVNTGVYVLEPQIFDYIPKNKFYDFGNNVWPELMAKNIAIYTYEMKDYWCDIGDLTAYKSAQKHMLEKINSVVLNDTENNYILGENCKLSANVDIAKNNVIGNNCTIDENVVIEDSIIGDNVKIAKNVKLVDCIIMDNIHIKENTKLYAGIMVNEK